MTNPSEIIRDAIACRDDGQEPNYTADEYEQTMLAVARLEQSAAENVAQSLARVAQNGNDQVDALLFTADRARARASVGKSAPSPSSAIGLDAERVSKGAAPGFTRAQYEDEMMRLSKAAARPGESPAVSFARLAGDGHFDALYAAGELADEHERANAMSKAAPDDRFHRLLVDMAQMRKRSGETLDGACARLLAEDPIVRAAYDSTQGA